MNMDRLFCVDAIQNKVKAVAGISGVDIDLKTKKVAMQTETRTSVRMWAATATASVCR
jgi:copper chaperone CopZ